VGQLALAVTAICGAGLLAQDATTGRLTMRSSTIYGLISSVMQLARWTAYASFCSMIASFTPHSPQRMTSSCLIAAAFNRQLHDVPWIKILWVWSERRTRRMLDTLIDRQDRNVSRVRQPPVTKQ